MGSISRDSVKYVAGLARLELSDDELCTYSTQLASILKYIDKLNELQTDDVAPTSHAIASLKNVFRKDIPKSSLSAEAALANAPERSDSFFKVPQVIEGK